MTATTKRRIRTSRGRFSLEVMSGRVYLMSGRYRLTPLPAEVTLDSPPEVLRAEVERVISEYHERRRMLAEAPRSPIDPEDPGRNAFMDELEKQFLAAQREDKRDESR